MEYINAFPGYEKVFKEVKKADGSVRTELVNMYRGEDVGKGGYVYANPGMYSNVITLDVSSMHPSSILALNYFGDYTVKFKEMMDTRLMVKHLSKKVKEAHRNGLKAADSPDAMELVNQLKTISNGKLARFFENPDDTDLFDALAQAYKLGINSCFGMSFASFNNPMINPLNDNNIIALRGALFMVNLKHEVWDRGGTVVHIKTDSIKLAEPTQEIFDFAMEYGKKYGYNFEIEHKFEKICLVNNAVYVAKLALDDADWLNDCKKAADKGLPEPTRWTATGTQFQVPYVFKTLFSKEPIIFEDMCETKSVTTAIYLDMNEGLGEGEHNYHFVGKVGQFCPILEGKGGGLLVREKNGKYDAVGGSKGYRWLESEVVKAKGMEDCIDKSYYMKLVDAAVRDISEFGDFEWFSS